MLLLTIGFSVEDRLLIKGALAQVDAKASMVDLESALEFSGMRGRLAASMVLCTGEALQGDESLVMEQAGNAPVVVVLDPLMASDAVRLAGFGVTDFLLRDPLGECFRVFAVKLPIILQQGMRLERAQTRFKDFVEALPDIVYELNADGFFLFVNRAVSHLGVNPEDLLGKHFSAILHPEEVPRVSRKHVLPKFGGLVTGHAGSPKLFDERRTGNRCTSNLVVRLRKLQAAEEDGTDLQGVVTAYGEINAVGRTRVFPIGSMAEALDEEIGTIGIIRDVTVRKTHELELLQNEEKYRGILGRLAIAYAVVAEDGLVEEWSPALQHWYDVSPRKAVGRPFWDVQADALKRTALGEQHAAESRAELESFFNDLRAARSGFPAIEYQQMLYDRDGQKSFLSVRVADIVVGEERRFVLLFSDQTKANQKDAELFDLRQHVESEMLYHSYLMADLGHELRTPSVAIGQLTQLAAEEKDPARLKELLNHAQAAARQLTDLLENLVEFGQSKTRSLELKEKDTLFRQLAIEICDSFRVQAELQGLVLSLRTEESVPESLQLDPVRFSQVLRNLVSNAIKYTDEGKVEVICSFDTAQGLLMVRVIDTGRGIPKAEQESIFSRFEQGSLGKKSGQFGSGLGLAISRRLVELMGGTISVRSTPGVGSEFSFTVLPGAGAHAHAHRTRDSHKAAQGPLVVDKEAGYGGAAAVQGPKAASRSALARHRILVADDQEINLAYLVPFLENGGANTVTAVGSGMEVLAALHRGNFDLILLDQNMPHLRGDEVIKAIRSLKQYHAIPVVALTAYSDMRTARALLAAGFDEVCIKPLSVAQVAHLFRLKRGAAQKQAGAGSEGPARRHAGGQSASTESITDGDLAQAAPDEAVPGRMLFDRRAFEARYAGATEVSNSVVKTFLETVPVKIRQLEEAIARKDAEEIASVSHSLANAFGAILADGLMLLSRQLEGAARFDDPEECRRYFDLIESSMESLLDSIRLSMKE